MTRQKAGTMQWGPATIVLNLWCCRCTWHVVGCHQALFLGANLWQLKEEVTAPAAAAAAAAAASAAAAAPRAAPVASMRQTPRRPPKALLAPSACRIKLLM